MKKLEEIRQLANQVIAEPVVEKEVTEQSSYNKDETWVLAVEFGRNELAQEILEIINGENI